jgi:hypothetical protein
MSLAAHVEDLEINRQIEALQKRQAALAKLPKAEAKREALKRLIKAGIVNKNGKLSANYR